MTDFNLSDQGAPEINIELDEQTAEGIYSNLVMIAHSSEEFVLDFIRVVPGVQKARVKSRIIITPQHARRLLNALKDNVRRYEQSHGSIEESDSEPNSPLHFGGAGGEA